MPAERTRGGKQRAIAAQDDQKIDLFREVLPRHNRSARVDASGSFFVHQNSDFPLAEPLNKRRHHGTDHFLKGFAYDANGANHDGERCILFYACVFA